MYKGDLDLSTISKWTNEKKKNYENVPVHGVAVWNSHSNNVDDITSLKVEIVQNDHRSVEFMRLTCQNKKKNDQPSIQFK